MNIYIAAAFNGKDEIDTHTKRENCKKLKAILEQKYSTAYIYAPWELRFPNAWDYPNTEWGTNGICGRSCAFRGRRYCSFSKLWPS